MLEHGGQSEKVLLDPEVLLDQTSLKSVSLEHEPDGTPRIQIALTEVGRKRFEEITTANLHKRLGIVLNSQLYAAPVIVMPMHGNGINISGNLTGSEATELVKKLNVAIGAENRPLAGEYILVIFDGNLHAQKCAIIKQSECSYLTITESGYLPTTKPIKMFAASQGFRLALTPDLITSDSKQSIDAFIMSLQQMEDHQFWGSYTATEPSTGNKITCTVLLHPLNISQQQSVSPNAIK